MWIVAIGLAEISHTYAGPFNSLAEAAVWLVETKLNTAHCHILQMHTPQEVADNLRHGERNVTPTPSRMDINGY